MAKQRTALVRIQIPEGQATAGPPVATALGPHGVNIGQFVSAFNNGTKDSPGLTFTVDISIYRDRTLDFVVKSPPASVLLKRAAGIAQGSGEPNKEKVGRVTREQLEDIAKTKMDDLNTDDLDEAVKMVEGTARSMGIEWDSSNAERGEE